MTPVGALEASALGEALRQSNWLYSSVEIAHLLGVALLFGSVAVLDLRLIGVWQRVPVKPLAIQILPWSAASFLIIVPTGLLMFVAHATDYIQSGLFALKICLIMAAGVNAAAFHAVTFRTADAWNSPPWPARLAGALSLALWASVIACGRLLADY